ncbi:MAG: phage protease [Sphingobium sp.]
MPAIIQVAANGIAMAAGAAPPRRVKLLPIGRVDMRDGRGPFLVRDQAHAAAIVARTRLWLGSADMMFDYDHQSIFSAGEGKGGTAIAAGWAKAANLTAEADGIYANDVAWTTAGAAKIAAREYRYISPLFLAAKGTGEVLQIKNAALVNMGAIDLPAVAASLSGPGQVETTLSADELAVCASMGWNPADFLAEKNREVQAHAASRMLSAEERAVCAALGTSEADFLRYKGAEAAIAASEVTARSVLAATELAICASMHWEPAEFLAEKNREAQMHAASALLSPEEIAVCHALGTSHADFLAMKSAETVAAGRDLMMGGKFEGGEFRQFTLEELKALAEGEPTQIQVALTPGEQHQCRQLGWSFASYLAEKIRQMEEDYSGARTNSQSVPRKS